MQQTNANEISMELMQWLKAPHIADAKRLIEMLTEPFQLSTKTEMKLIFSQPQVKELPLNSTLYTDTNWFRYVGPQFTSTDELFCAALPQFEGMDSIKLLIKDDRVLALNLYTNEHYRQKSILLPRGLQFTWMTSYRRADNVAEHVYSIDYVF